MEVHKSLDYHHSKHGDGKSVEQYLSDSQEFARNPSGKRVTAVDLADGTKGIKYRTKGAPGGIIDEYGNIITFWYK